MAGYVAAIKAGQEGMKVALQFGDLRDEASSCDFR